MNKPIDDWSNMNTIHIIQDLVQLEVSQCKSQVGAKHSIKINLDWDKWQ